MSQICSMLLLLLFQLCIYNYSNSIHWSYLIGVFEQIFNTEDDAFIWKVWNSFEMMLYCVKLQLAFCAISLCHCESFLLAKRQCWKSFSGVHNGNSFIAKMLRKGVKMFGFASWFKLLLWLYTYYRMRKLWIVSWLVLYLERKIWVALCCVMTNNVFHISSHVVCLFAFFIKFVIMWKYCEQDVTFISISSCWPN